jgi:hypothetical protein
MKVLVACEESQAVCKEFRRLGHEAYSCDLQECSGGHPEWHILGDAIKATKGGQVTTMDGVTHDVGKWDLLIAHPPCTYMSKAGARWMYPVARQVDPDRLEKAMQAKEFFMKFYNADCDRICIENPTPLKVVGLPKEIQAIQPYMFGDPYSKRTLLWLKGLPELKPTNVLEDFVPYLPSNTGGFSRGKGGSRGVAHNAKDASKTFTGVAKAMAEQWGGQA